LKEVISMSKKPNELEQRIAAAESEVKKLEKALAETEVTSKEYAQKQYLYTRALSNLDTLKKMVPKRTGLTVEKVTALGGMIIGAAAVGCEACGNYFRTDTAKTVIRSCINKLMK
jgi:uncharacterized coiled-coil protein SlyX